MVSLILCLTIVHVAVCKLMRFHYDSVCERYCYPICSVLVTRPIGERILHAWAKPCGWKQYSN